jgi:hypothetical protein
MGHDDCCVKSNMIRIEAAERSWGDVKQLKSDNRAHLCIESVECQSVIFGASSLQEERVIHKNAKTVEGVDVYANCVFNREEAIYDLGIGKFGVDVDELQLKCLMTNNC